jgi:hypothetical protein
VPDLTHRGCYAYNFSYFDSIGASPMLLPISCLNGLSGKTELQIEKTHLSLAY